MIFAFQVEITIPTCQVVNYICVSVEENSAVYTEQDGSNNAACLDLTLTKNCQPGELCASSWTGHWPGTDNRVSHVRPARLDTGQELPTG